ncbi:MAG TPA: GspE/PulE family protein [Caulobacteraceae bacterium]|nr:GspE/PulE family protein [Caulobacteraceae bacterium]
MGELLVARGLVSERELADALAMQALTGGLLGQLLIRIGAISEIELNKLLSEQLGLKVLDNEETPTAAQVGKFLGEIRSPIPWWVQHQAAAWRAGEALDSPVMVAAVNPLDPALGDRLAQLGEGPVQLRLATRAAVTGLLDSVAQDADTAARPGAPSETARLRELAQETPVIDFVNGIFAEALSRRASDIHVEPFADHFAVRLRIDGVLVTVRTAPRARFDAVCSRIKLLSGMDIGERRLPQDGRQSIRAAGQELDLRISSLPSVWGESLVLRLLGRIDRLPKLAELGVSDAQAAKLLALVDKPNGIVLVSGPTGSGKTTTIYRLLVHLNNGARKIVTVEDPVEFELPGVVQVQARRDIGLSFAAGLRSILRQDPDVIMVGEIRDQETARIAVQAALTGHLVISTIHTNSALAAAPRLLDLDVEPFLLADVLRGLVGQRLVRRLCPHCARPSDAERVASYEAQRPAGLVTKGAAAWREPVGCEQCAQTGYLGRLGLYEIALTTPELEHDIREGASEAALTRTARAGGFESLADDGYAKARAGLTSLAEVRRAADAPDAI